jgi:hypothetical protein
MEDIKARLAIVKQIVRGRSPLRDEGLDGEIVCLMLRKVLEQIAFASLAAHSPEDHKVHAFKTKEVEAADAPLHVQEAVATAAAMEEKPRGHLRSYGRLDSPIGAAPDTRRKLPMLLPNLLD